VDVETCTEHEQRRTAEQKQLRDGSREEVKAIVRTRDPAERMVCPFCGVEVSAQNFIRHRDKCVGE
jgi:hypothetical protein